MTGNKSKPKRPRLVLIHGGPAEIEGPISRLGLSARFSEKEPWIWALAAVVKLGLLAVVFYWFLR